MKEVLVYILLSLVACGSLHANEYSSPGGASVCFTDVETVGEFQSGVEFERRLQWYAERPNTLFLLRASSPRCEDRETLLDGLEMISIIFEGAALVSAACSAASGGLSVPAAVTFGAFGVVTRVAKFTIKNLPCRNVQSRKEIERLTKETLCLALGQGRSCQFDKIRCEYKDEQRYTPRYSM